MKCLTNHNMADSTPALTVAVVHVTKQPEDDSKSKNLSFTVPPSAGSVGSLPR